MKGHRFVWFAFVLALFAAGTFAQQGGTATRDRLADLEHVRGELWFNEAAKSIRGEVRLSFRAFTQAITRLEVDAVDMTIRSVTDGATPLRHTYDGKTIRIQVPEPGRMGITISIAYETKPEKGLYFRGPGPAWPNRARQIFTQGESEDTRYWLPVVDAPNEMAVTEMILHVKESYVALANGKLVDRAPDGKGMSVWHWRMSHPHATYLIALVIGEMEGYREEWSGIPLEYWVGKGDGEKAPRTYRNTMEMMVLYSTITGIKYPWDKYAQATVSDYMYGGMENTSLTVLTDSTLRDERAMEDGNSDGLVAHELAHQWFGDLVTCRDWANAWLNEGFASYYEALWDEYALGKDAFAENMYDKARGAMGAYRRHPRPLVSYRAEDEGYLFDGTTYEKGAWVLHMLRQELGNRGFHAAVERYLRDNAHRNVDTYDLVRAVQDSTGRYMQPWFQQWVFSPGHPVLEVSHTFEAGKGTHITVKQVQDFASGVPVFDFPLDVAWENEKGLYLDTVRVTAKEQSFLIDTGSAPRQLVVDPYGLILADVKQARTNAEWMRTAAYGPSSLARLKALDALQKAKPGIEWTDTLLTILHADNRPLVRAAALDAFNAMQQVPVEVAAEARTALDDASPEVRASAAALLGAIPPDGSQAPMAREALWIVYTKDSSYQVQATALGGLVALGHPQLKEAIAQALETPSYREIVRRAGIHGLVATAPPGAAGKLRALAAVGNSSWVRTEAMDGVVELEGPTAATAKWLGTYLKDDVRWVARNARAQLIDMAEKVPEAKKILAAANLEANRDDRWIQDHRREDGKDDADRPSETVESLKAELAELSGDNQALRERIADLEKRLAKLGWPAATGARTP